MAILSSHANSTNIHLTENSVGYNFSFDSKVLEQQREIQIYLPDDYDKSSKKYPVLYVVDSQQYFLHPITYQNTLREEDETPGVIVVGIKMKSETRRSLLFKQSKKFISFLENELLPFIDKNYRTLQNERMYFGWEIAGGLALQLFAEKPELFKGYFVASATHFTADRLKAAEKLLDSNIHLNHYFYFTLGSVESWAVPSNNKLKKLLTDKAPATLRWRYDLLDEDNHYSTPLTTFNQGLKEFFSDYIPIRFYSMQQFNEFGGMQALYQFFEQRGERYGLSKDIHRTTQGYLLNLTVNNNDYLNFKIFVKEFEGVFEEYFNWEYSFNKYGQFYLTHRAPVKAREIFNIGLTKFPHSATLESGLGDSYRMQGNKEKAITHYQRSLELVKNYSAIDQDEFASTLSNFDSGLTRIKGRLKVLRE